MTQDARRTQEAGSAQQAFGSGGSGGLLTRREVLRGAAALGLSAAAGGALAACGGSGQKSGSGATTTAPAGATTAPATSATLRLAIQAAEGTLTPYTYVTGYPGYNLLTLVYDTLMVLDEKNKPRPLLAQSLSVSSDGLTYTLALRQGVTWHDGAPFSADDVVFTFSYVTTHLFSRWTAEVKAVKSVTQQGNTVTITLSQPQADFVVATLADLPILPKHIWSQITTPKNASNATGTGPYKLAEYVQNQRYTMSANAGYFLGKPSVDQIVIPFIPETATIFSALRAGQIDVTSAQLNPSLVAQFQGGDLAVARGPGYISSLLQINDGRGVLGKAAVRRALALAIDPATLIKTALLGFGVPGNLGYAAPGSPLDIGFSEYPVDPGKAQAVLDGLGYAKGPGGVRVADGAPMQFTLLVKSTAPTDIRVAQLIADMVGQIGIKLTVDPLDATALDQKVWPGFDVSKGRDYDLSMWGWSAPIMLGGTQLGKLLGSTPQSGPDNVGGFTSPTVDTLIAKVDTTVDATQHVDALRSLEQQIASQVPFVTLYYPDLLYGYRPAAYKGWVFQAGQGILQKLSFVRLQP